MGGSARLWLWLLAAAALVGVVAVDGVMSRRGGAQEEIRRRQWPVMGTVAQVAVKGGGDAESAQAVAKARYARVEQLLSAWDADSELCRLSAAGCTNFVQAASADVRECYAAAFRLMKQSGGAFNPFLGAKLRALGVGRNGKYCDLDLGAIAKGFAVDCAAKELERVGTRQPTLLDLGGNLRVVGEGSWRTGVRNPFDRAGAPLAELVLTNGESVATSGNYERFVVKNGRRVSHILDGRTGEPVSGMAGVTVVTPREYGAMLADGLSTTLFVLGPEAGQEFLRRHYPLADALWIPDTPQQPRLIATPTLSKRLVGVDQGPCRTRDRKDGTPP